MAFTSWAFHRKRSNIFGVFIFNAIGIKSRTTIFSRRFSVQVRIFSTEISKLFGHSFQHFGIFLLKREKAVKIDRYTYSCLQSLEFVLLFNFVFVWVSLTLCCEYSNRIQKNRERATNRENKNETLEVLLSEQTHDRSFFVWRLVRWTFWAVLLNRPLIKVCVFREFTTENNNNTSKQITLKKTKYYHNFLSVYIFSWCWKTKKFGKHLTWTNVCDFCRKLNPTPDSPEEFVFTLNNN